jgi:hypothetical protein
MIDIGKLVLALNSQGISDSDDCVLLHQARLKERLGSTSNLYFQRLSYIWLHLGNKDPTWRADGSHHVEAPILFPHGSPTDKPDQQ